MIVLAVGGAVMIACLGLQALFGALAARYFAAQARKPPGRRPRTEVFRQFTIMMLVLMTGNIAQAMIWAALYWLIGAFPDFATSLYFSGVTFTSLGYGDVVLPVAMRLLAPLQAANGLMMFGITTALFFAAVQAGIARRQKP